MIRRGAIPSLIICTIYNLLIMSMRTFKYIYIYIYNLRASVSPSASGNIVISTRLSFTIFWLST